MVVSLWKCVDGVAGTWIYSTISRGVEIRDIIPICMISILQARGGRTL